MIEEKKKSITPTVANRPTAVANRTLPSGNGSALSRSTPIVNRSPMQRPATGGPPMHQRSGKGKILVVDDEPAITDSLVFMLNHEGYKAEAAYSGNGAIDKAVVFRPDLVISDVVMPGKSGIEACIEISRALPTCKAMLFSGQAISKDMVEVAGREGHAFDLIEKPLHPQELLSRVRIALNR